MSSPVTITGNEARFDGGAILNEGSVYLPSDADISNNTAIVVRDKNISCFTIPFDKRPRSCFRQTKVDPFGAVEVPPSAVVLIGFEGALVLAPR